MIFEDKLRKRTRGRALLIMFHDIAWANRAEGLKQFDFINTDILKLSEVEVKDAEKLLIAALSTDLCYGRKIMSSAHAKELAKEFIGLQDEQAQYFTNSSVPYHKKENSWSFTPITEATIDTGIIVKLGKQLDSVIWMADID